MVTLQRTLELRFPAAEVFGYMANPGNMPEWVTFMKEMVVEGNPGKGSKVSCTFSVKRKSIKMHGEITALEEGKLFSLKSGPGSALAMEITLEFAEMKGITFVKWTISYNARTPVIGPFADLMSAGFLRDEMERSFSRIKTEFRTRDL